MGPMAPLQNNQMEQSLTDSNNEYSAISWQIKFSSWNFGQQFAWDTSRQKEEKPQEHVRSWYYNVDYKHIFYNLAGPGKPVSMLSLFVLYL